MHTMSPADNMLIMTQAATNIKWLGSNKKLRPLQAVQIKLTEFVFCSSERWQGEPNLEVNLWVKKGGWQTMYHQKHFLCSTIILLFRFVSEHCLRSTLRLFQLLVVFVQYSLYTSLELKRFFNFQHELIL